jgi:hypothetical protein
LACVIPDLIANVVLASGHLCSRSHRIGVI